MYVSVTCLLYNLIQVCRARGVDCIVAPYEADAQLAYLNKAGIAQVIITEDSDLLLFGCEKVSQIKTYLSQISKPFSKYPALSFIISIFMVLLICLMLNALNIQCYADFVALHIYVHVCVHTCVCVYKIDEDQKLYFRSVYSMYRSAFNAC